MFVPGPEENQRWAWRNWKKPCFLYQNDPSLELIVKTSMGSIFLGVSWEQKVLKGKGELPGGQKHISHTNAANVNHKLLQLTHAEQEVKWPFHGQLLYCIVVISTHPPLM